MSLRSQPVVLWLLLLSVVLAVGYSFYKYEYIQSFQYTVEASCDPAQQVCYQRDCSAGDCPPNDLDTFRVFTIPASEFENCADDSCTNICPSTDHQCTEIMCSEDQISVREDLGDDSPTCTQ